MLTVAITRPPFTYITFSFLLFNLIDTWEFHFNLLLCIVYICACISFWLISFYLWLVLVFLFSRIYYGFTPLWHWMSRHLQTIAKVLGIILHFGSCILKRKKGSIYLINTTKKIMNWLSHFKVKRWWMFRYIP